MPDEAAFQKQIYKLSHHEISHIQIKPWSHVDLHKEVVTISNHNFSVDHASKWRNLTPHEECEHLEMRTCNSSLAQVSLCFDRIKLENFLIFKPSPYSRKVPIPSFKERIEVVQMTIVTNQHIWCKMSIKKKSQKLNSLAKSLARSS